MSRRIVVGVFDNERGLLSATREARQAGLTIADAYTPYAVHGLDEAMGLRPSRLPWLCFGAAVVGAVAKLWFEFWTTMVDWPINVGGKPWNSLPAFVPVTFEVMVLAAGVSTMLGFLMLSGLKPGRRPKLVHERVTDDRFALVLEGTNAQFEFEGIRQMLQQHGAVEVEERVEGE